MTRPRSALRSGIVMSQLIVAPRPWSTTRTSQAASSSAAAIASSWSLTTVPRRRRRSGGFQRLLRAGPSARGAHARGGVDGGDLPAGSL